MKSIWLLALVLTGMTSVAAMGQSDRYRFEIISEADPDNVAGFVSILSASMNGAGAVAFDAIAAGETLPVVYFTDQDPCDLFSCGEVADGVTPVINNDGWIGFFTVDGDGIITGISRYDTDSGDLDVLEAADGRVLSGLAVSDGDPPSNVAYWSFEFELGPPVTTEQCVAVVDDGGLGACSDSLNMQLSAPVINTGGILSYVSSETAGPKTLVLDDEEPLVIDASGSLSAPTINNGGTAAVFCQDASHDAGIYTVTTIGATLFAALDGARTPAPNTRPFINGNGAMAYTAVEAGAQTVFTQNNAESVAVIAAGDSVPGDAGEVVSLEVYARNSCGVLFIAGVDDDADDIADRTVLVRATYRFDLTCDGSVNVLDLLQMLGAWGPNPGHPADLNGDSTVNVLDLLLLLGAWGVSP